MRRNDDDELRTREQPSTREEKDSHTRHCHDRSVLSYAFGGERTERGGTDAREGMCNRDDRIGSRMHNAVCTTFILQRLVS